MVSFQEGSSGSSAALSGCGWTEERRLAHRESQDSQGAAHSGQSGWAIWGSGFFIHDDGELTLFGSVIKCYGEAQSPAAPLCLARTYLGTQRSQLGSSPKEPMTK